MTEAELRRFVRSRAEARCEYCRLPDWFPPVEPFHLEHITARQHGGEKQPENLAWACHRCNRHKGTNLSGIDPDSRQVVPLFHPRQHQWSDHFVLEGARLLGKTPTGRATVWLLQMNTERRLDRRAELVRDGRVKW